jgi:hypothetical protein
MGSFTNDAENTILDAVFGGSALGAPATYYVALTTTAPTDSAAGTEVSTGTWTNYARVAVTNNATNFPAASGGAKSNGTAIAFGTASTSGNVSVAGLELWSASSGGTRWGWATLTATVANGNVVTVAVGDLDITLD